MAYRAIPASAPLLPTRFGLRTKSDAELLFDPLERKVIALAEADPVASIGPPSRLARFFERWFGFALPAPLADPRLEALRRFAVLARVSEGDLPHEEIARFVEAGFSPFQARALQRRAANA